MFYKEHGNVLTKENLQHIKRVENEFLENKEFKTKFCLLKANGECYKPLSLIRFFDGTYSYASSVFNDPDFNNINAVINEAQRYKKIKKHIPEKCHIWFFVERSLVKWSGILSTNLGQFFVCN